jgi:hypothetical protein
LQPVFLRLHLCRQRCPCERSRVMPQPHEMNKGQKDNQKQKDQNQRTKQPGQQKDDKQQGQKQPGKTC